jgi:hypothetical protein
MNGIIAGVFISAKCRLLCDWERAEVYLSRRKWSKVFALSLHALVRDTTTTALAWRHTR